MLREMFEVIKDLNVYPHNMNRNMNVYGYVVFSQKVLLDLVKKGMIREDAYKIVQECAHSAWNVDGGSFIDNIKENVKVREYLNDSELLECFNTDKDRSNLDFIWARL